MSKDKNSDNILRQSVTSGIWACPVCGSQLDEGLKCLACSFSGYIDKGLLYLHKMDESWEQCIVEKNGWVSMLKQIGIYGENEDHFYLPDLRPHLKDFYRESKQHLDAFLKVENLDGKVCLDLGASIGWVEAYIKKTYVEAQLIALEVNDDEFIGIGRANSLKKYHNCDFDCVVADMHFLPLKSNSIDVVFTVDALHHFREIEVIYNEIKRVLKPGGKFYALNEPDRPEGIEEEQYIQEHIHLEKENNIIERRPTIYEYLQAGSDLHLKMLNDEVGLRKSIDTCGLFLVGEK